MVDRVQFQSARMLVRRATEHVNSIRRAVREFADVNPPEQYAEAPGADGFAIVMARVTGTPPVEIALLAFDAVCSLRSCLDHAVFESTAMITGNPSPDDTKFPFGRTRVDAENNFRSQGKGVPLPLRDLLLSYGPYSPPEAGANPQLAGLNALRNMKIHRALVPMVAATGGIGIGGVGYVEQMEFRGVPKIKDPKTGFQSITSVRAAGVHGITMVVRSAVAFGDDQPFAGQALDQVFRGLLDLCRDIVEELEDVTMGILSAPIPAAAPAQAPTPAAPS